MPNQALQQTGHANDGSAWRHAATRVSRLLSLLFGEEGNRVDEGLQPGDRVLDLRALTRSGGMFGGFVVVPVATGLSGWWWGYCALAALLGGIVGLVMAEGVGRVVFRAPPGQIVIARVGPAALGLALRASLAGSLPVCIIGFIGGFLGAGWLAAVVALLLGLAVSAGIGCLSALV